MIKLEIEMVRFGLWYAKSRVLAEYPSGHIHKSVTEAQRQSDI